jgi:ubiquitin carboxyl-terminal hydrolase 34
LNQLRDAAKKLTSFNDGTTSGDDESMVIVATDTQVLEQERMFIRSLAVLRQFLQAHQSKAHFATADLRPLMPPSPTMVVGESAELKFQSFDGDKQTEVQPLNIGRQNTAASLLASLREATGFENYRIYYKGKVFIPDETKICKSLEDLSIHDGLILVKREEEGAPPSSRMRPGASPLEIAILSHFEELWGYLSLEEKFAQEVGKIQRRRWLVTFFF